MPRFAPISIVLSIILVAALWPRDEVVRYDAPVILSGASAADASASEEETHSTSAVSGGTAEDVPWLHVEVETKYAWIYQKSVGRAWTTVSREDTTRVNVGELCIELEAHGKHTLCESDTSYLEITDLKRRLACKKKTAVVSAWTQAPNIKKTTVKMEP
ncbi:MAG: hypothetical protein KDB65_07545 [Calditrichaeota bacterium]|nr:hypothetical protein [Calditrichota bacterium]MCB9369322.1 hypothetical protein [Calditrichota bacterium]